ncbi:preprotein translocase subunit YajC [Aquihabitans sp. McL0605]|uniref:preprotein translocase subunit YajC n=1 Tax=Aquihabitans sp. McL0605 TaxID=3415671 RepID=UPI003CF63BFC
MPALILTLLLIPVFWALIVRPQQKRQRVHAMLVDSLVAGDRVEAFSGIHGTLVEVGDETVRIEVADGVVLTMARLAISTRLEDDEDGEGDDEQDDDVDQQLTGSTDGADEATATIEGEQS